MKNLTALLIDIGSTYTKVVLYDLINLKIIGQNQSFTTVTDDVNVGLKKALKEIPGWEQASYKLACSSAAGGLKLVAIGLVPDLTAEAARRAALGSGGKVLHTFSYQLTIKDMEQLKKLNPDIILLAGGTDGGDQDTIIYNARVLAKSKLTQPVIIAGNKKAVDRVETIFKKEDKKIYLTENVMPELGEINIKPAQAVIRQLFLEKIIQAKGLEQVNQFIDGIIMPTPAAVLKAAELLADGVNEIDGLGELMVIDVGGATTDVYSIASGKPAQAGVNWRGLMEPYAKRTVEGDLGMRYSAPSLYEAVGEKFFYHQLDKSGCKRINIEKCHKFIEFLHKNVNYIPLTDEEQLIDDILGRNAVRLATARHVGLLKTIYTPLGASYIQEGKDLTKIKLVIGTGGIMVHNQESAFILNGVLYKNQQRTELLAPLEPKFKVDKKYIMAAAGLLAEKRPDKALLLMKKYLVDIQED